jgi:hypothetical protein
MVARFRIVLGGGYSVLSSHSYFIPINFSAKSIIFTSYLSSLSFDVEFTCVDWEEYDQASNHQIFL